MIKFCGPKSAYVCWLFAFVSQCGYGLSLCVASEQQANSDGTSSDQSTSKPATKRLDTLDYETRSLLKQAAQLRARFSGVRDRRMRQRAALSLVLLGDPDNKYENYLIRCARETIESEIPFPLKLNSRGMLIRKAYSDEFCQWCKQHNEDVDALARRAIYDAPGDVAILAQTGDSSSWAILLQGLRSRNVFIRIEAAKGLGRIGDKRAIQPIIDAIEASPKEAQVLIARALMYFDDPLAKDTVDRLVPKDQRNDLLKIIDNERRWKMAVIKARAKR